VLVRVATGVAGVTVGGTVPPIGPPPQAHSPSSAIAARTR
jgi:hypothetical protein